MGLLSLWGEEGLTIADEAFMLLLTSGNKLTIVVFKDDPVSWWLRGQFLDHLINFSLVPLLGSFLSSLEEVQDFLTFFRKAGFFGLF